MRHALHHRHAEYRALMTAVVAICGLAVLGSVLPAVEDATNVLVLAALGLALLVALLRRGVRWVRERIEDAAAARTAAAWRARHAPHLLTASTPARPVAARMPAGVVQVWAVTGWAIATWLRVTVLVALGVGAAWLWCTPGWFVACVILGVLVELWAIRQLVREWCYEARWSWWWAR